MANWGRKKVMSMAKGFTGRRKNVFGIALRAVHKAAQYMYRDRKQKKRIVRREWISTINAATREHGMSYSRFAFALEKNSNIELDRKILSALAVSEPYSFKAVFDEVKLQSGLEEMAQRKPLVAQMTGVSYMEAINKGFIVPSKI
jgi:large subunit ribosomal protein L20